jgi:glycerophosphoryl diester phosphodiesterase
VSLDALATEACAHRGDTKSAPENTLPAFISAVNKKAPQIEFDLHLTKDGQLVVIHDSTVDRTTNGKGRVADMTFDEIRALDAGGRRDPKFQGTRIPTLHEVLEVVPHDILCNVHLKDVPGVAEAAARVLAETNRLDHCFLACTIEQAKAAKAIAPTIKICNMSRQGFDVDAYVNSTIECGAEFIQLAGGEKTLKETVQKLHAHKITVNFFEAHTEEKIRLCIEAGVDFILTDDLDLCLRVTQEKEAGGAP